MHTIELNHLTIAKRLHDVSTLFEGGKLHGLTGPNGSGKSTLLKAIAGVVKVDSGAIFCDRQDLNGLDRRTRSRLITYISGGHSTPYPYTVGEMVAMGLYAANGSPTDVDLCLERVDAASMKESRFSELSSGEKQRILIARGLATKCPILLFDEPTANLDLRYQQLIWDLICSLASENYTVIIASHDLEQIRSRCNNCLILDRGAILTEGCPHYSLLQLKDMYHPMVSS